MRAASAAARLWAHRMPAAAPAATPVFERRTLHIASTAGARLASTLNKSSQGRWAATACDSSGYGRLLQQQGLAHQRLWRGPSRAASTAGAADALASALPAVPAVTAERLFDAATMPVVRGYPDLSVTTSTMDAGGYIANWMHAVEWVHSATGLPWWQTVVAASLVLRMATLPFFFKSVRGAGCAALVRMQRVAGGRPG
jgi:hypothetical protein